MEHTNNNKCYIKIGCLCLSMALLLAGCTGKSSTTAVEQEIQAEQVTPDRDEADAVTEAEQEAQEPAESPAKKEETGTEGATPSPLQGDLYGNYVESGGEIACVIDGSLLDGSYNEAIRRGIQTYALAAGISFSYYHTLEAEPDTYEEVISRAVQNKAKVIVCSGYGFGEAVGKLQKEYPEVSFLMIDGVPMDEKGKAVEMAENVHSVVFKEEEAGFLAGYMAVKDGYHKFGFIGGKEDPPVIRYGYGYLQGIDAAAKEIEASDVEVNYWYSGAYEPNERIVEKAGQWYKAGTEIIFSCGGALYQSVVEAAQEYDGLIIGVDIDQHGLSEHFLTSAFKDVENAVVISLDNYYATGGCWPEEAAGKIGEYGIENNCVGIPTLNTEWRFKTVTLSDYYEICRKLKKKEVTVADQTQTRPKVSVRVHYMK